MFSLRQKREIADKVQAILGETNHPELPEGEIKFTLHVEGAETWSWADIQNNKAVTNPGVNPHNENQDPLELKLKHERKTQAHITVDGVPYCLAGSQFPTAICSCGHSNRLNAETDAKKLRSDRPDLQIEVADGYCGDDPFWSSPKGRAIIEHEDQFNQMR